MYEFPNMDITLLSENNRKSFEYMKLLKIIGYDLSNQHEIIHDNKKTNENKNNQSKDAITNLYKYNIKLVTGLLI